MAQPPGKPFAQAAPGLYGYLQCCVPSILPETDAAPMLPQPEIVNDEHTACSEPCPRCGFIQAAEAAAERLIGEWDAARTPPQGKVTAADLAVEFYRELQRRELTQKPIRSGWIKGAYPVFARSRGVVWPPPFKDFAKALGQLMPRKRVEKWRRGRRLTETVYSMPTNVVPLGKRPAS